MERQNDFRFPNDFCRCLKGAEDGPVGHVALACGSEAAIEGHLEAGSVGIALVEKRGGLLRSHGVTAGGTDADFIDVLDGFHSVGFCCKGKAFEGVLKKKRKIFAKLFGGLKNVVFLQPQKQGALAQLARALAWHARGHRFDSVMLHKTPR